MSMSNFVFGDDIIDSREVVSRLEELQGDRDDLNDSLDVANEEYDKVKRYDQDMGEDDPDPGGLIEECYDEVEYIKDSIADLEKDELEPLEAFCSVGEGYSEWSSGVSLIHEDHFVEYTKQLIDDAYEMPVELDQGGWPWDHISIDYDAAAEALKQDYGTIEFEEETYYLQA